MAWRSQHGARRAGATVTGANTNTPEDFAFPSEPLQWAATFLRGLSPQSCSSISSIRACSRALAAVLGAKFPDQYPVSLDLQFTSCAGLTHPISIRPYFGGLMAYSLDGIQSIRQAAQQIAQILNSANPAEMPFRRPTSFKLSINTKAAREIGVTIPPILLATADEVIE